jgi:hypothetical protein
MELFVQSYGNTCKDRRRPGTMPPMVIVVLGAICAFVILPVVAAYFERRIVWPYSEAEPIQDWQGLDPYCLGQLTEAQTLRFKFLGRADFGSSLNPVARRVDGGTRCSRLR